MDGKDDKADMYTPTSQTTKGVTRRPRPAVQSLPDCRGADSPDRPFVDRAASSEDEGRQSGTLLLSADAFAMADLGVEHKIEFCGAEWMSRYKTLTL